MPTHFPAALCRAAFACAVACAPGLASADTFFPLDPKASYLHTNQDAATAAPAIDLAALGYAPGDRLLLRVQGDIDNGPGGDSFTFTLGMFSSSATLLGSELLNRVPGALASDAPGFISASTWFGNQATDIAQDFGFDKQLGLEVTVPAGARFLFLAKHDQLYQDNSDPDHDYGVWIGLAAVPEPPAWALALAGAAVLGLRAQRRRRCD